MTTRAAERATRRVTLELENRAGMLCVHGGILLMIGLMMALTGAPAPTEDWFGPWSRLAMGGFAMASGAVLLWGVAAGDERKGGWLAMTLGTGGACWWHVGLTATYAYAAIVGRMEILAPGEPLSEAITSRGYIPLVYLGYVLLLMIHNVTLLRLGPPPR